MKKFRKFKNSDEGIVGIVATFLVIGLIVSVISMVQLVYIPKWMEQTEAGHMETVANQFSQLKFAIDTQSAIKQRDNPISTSITLGNKEMPFLMSSRAYGSLNIIPDQCSIYLKGATFEDTIKIGIIKYSSDNQYYLDQSFIYEAGAVILSQSQENTMYTKPMFSTRNNPNQIINFTIVNITTISGEEREIGGYGTYPIHTEYSSSEPIVFVDNLQEITITTQYPNAWETFLKKHLENFGLTDNVDFNMIPNDNGVTVTFDGTEIDLNFNQNRVDTQISPGWVDNVKGMVR